eukprot:s635_g24.t1
MCFSCVGCVQRGWGKELTESRCSCRCWCWQLALAVCVCSCGASLRWQFELVRENCEVYEGLSVANVEGHASARRVCLDQKQGRVELLLPWPHLWCHPKRRSTAPAVPAKRAVSEVVNVAAAHCSEPGSLIKIKAYMVLLHPLKQVAVRGVEKPLVSVPWLQLQREVVLADQTGVVHLELWDGLAKGNISSLTQADAKDGFALVTVNKALPDLYCERQIRVGTAGPHLPAPDHSGHYRTSTASSRSQWALPDLNREFRSQWALPDLNREFQIAVGTAGPQPRAPDPRPVTAWSWRSGSRVTREPDLNREPQIPVGTAGPETPDRMPERMSKDMPDRMPERMSEDMRDRMPD